MSMLAIIARCQAANILTVGVPSVTGGPTYGELLKPFEPSRLLQLSRIRNICRFGLGVNRGDRVKSVYEISRPVPARFQELRLAEVLDQSINRSPPTNSDINLS